MSRIDVTGDRILIDGRFTAGTITVEDGIIRAVGPKGSSDGRRDEHAASIDADGLMVVPGFIDLQINGGYGHDIAADPQSMWALGSRLPATGVTAFLPTIISSPPTTTDAAIEAIGNRPAQHRGAEPIGLHFEGPMLSRQRPGAHPIGELVDPDPAVITGWSRPKGVALVTLAPELLGASNTIETLVERGVAVSAGHTEATAEDAAVAIEAGMSMVTHLFNAMAPLEHRRPNLVGRALADDRLTVGVIADGVHVDPLVVATAWRAKGPNRLALVTDAVAPMGLGAGRYRLGSGYITADDRSVRNDDGVLAGSILTMNQAVRNLIEFSGCDIVDAIATVTTTPASLLGETIRGRIGPGAVGDLVLLDRDLNVQLTVCGGRVAHITDGAHHRLLNDNDQQQGS